MTNPTKLWKTTLMIWSDYNPSDLKISDLAREAECGDSFCNSREDELITDPTQFPETEFFDDGEIINRPQFYSCGICDHCHPIDWNGDCRDDANRFTSAALDERYGPEGWEEVGMPT